MAHLDRPQRNSHRTEEAARTHPHVGLSWALPEGLQRPKEAGTRPLGPPGDSCQLPGRQALSRSPCTPVTRRPLPEFPLAANSSALPRPHTHAHPRHNTTHTHLHSTRTCARVRVRAPELSRSPGSEILKLLWRDPWLPRGGTLEHRPGTGPWCGSGVSAAGLWKRGQTLRWRLALDWQLLSTSTWKRFSQLQGFLLFYIISAYSEGKNGAASSLRAPENSTHQQIPQTPI